MTMDLPLRRSRQTSSDDGNVWFIVNRMSLLCVCVCVILVLLRDAVCVVIIRVAICMLSFAFLGILEVNIILDSVQ